jgi:hypothetical protein
MIIIIAAARFACDPDRSGRLPNARNIQIAFMPLDGTAAEAPAT